ncbi:family 20 glycosylhydrolase [bacterium]|nr:family 20 glycosylhydrolase [bacterium]
MTIIPRPKHIKILPGKFCLQKDTEIFVEKKYIQETFFLQEKLKKITGFNLKIISKVQDNSKKNIIFLKIQKPLPQVLKKEEGYIIKATQNLVSLIAGTDKGLFYACQSLIDLIEKENNKWIIPECEIRDWPDFPWRGFMIDSARQFIPVEIIKRYIDIMAHNKLNILHIHFSDSQSFTIESKKYPSLNKDTHKDRERGAYSRKDIKELTLYAGKHKIEIIPEIDLPGHATHILEQIPELRCNVKEGKVSEWVVCAGAEKTYEFIDKLFGEIAHLFPSKYFHIGTDEIEMKDIPGETTSWQKCYVCKDRMKKEKLTRFRELFYYFVNRTKKILKKYGKQTMMWNDTIDIGKPHNIPKDTLIHFWRIAKKNRGPRKGCSLSKFLKDGFKVVNSFYPETYIRKYVKEERLLSWHPGKRPPVPVKFRNSVLGGEMCAWGDDRGYEFYERVIPSTLALFGDRVWNREKVEYVEQFRTALPKHIFGPQLQDELDNLFEVLGAIIPPLKIEVRANIEGSLKGKTKKEKKKIYQSTEKTIRKELQEKKVFNLPYLKEYLKSVCWLREQRD